MCLQSLDRRGGFFSPDVHHVEEGSSRSSSQAVTSRPASPPPQDLGVQNMVRWLCRGRQWGGTHLKWPSLKCTQSSWGTHLDLFPGQSHPPFKWLHPGRPCCPGLEGDDGLQVDLIGAAFQRRNCHTQHIDFFFHSWEAISFCEASVLRR